MSIVSVKAILKGLYIPTYDLVCLRFPVVAAAVLGICFCCIRRCFRKRRAKDGKKGMKGVDLKPVQFLGSAYKEKVLPLPTLCVLNVFKFTRLSL